MLGDRRGASNSTPSHPLPLAGGGLGRGSDAAGVPPLVWRRSSAYSVAAEGADYAVSRALVLDLETRALRERFSAWHGPNLRDQPRETSRPARLLGVRPTAAAAKRLCAEHLAAHATQALALPLPGGGDGGA